MSEQKKEVKERVTYPRTGYVAYRHGEPSHGRSLIILAALLLFIANFLLPELLAKMSPMVGALLGILLAFMGYRVNLWRFYVAAVVALLTGLATAVFVPDELLGATLSFVLIGLALLLGGGITFVNYLQEHHPTEEEMQV